MTGQKADSPFVSIAPTLVAPAHSPPRILEPGGLSEAMKPHHCQDRAYVAHSGAELKLKSLSTTPHQGEFLLSEWPALFRLNLLDLSSFSTEATRTLTTRSPPWPLPTAQEEPSGGLHSPTVVTGSPSPESETDLASYCLASGVWPREADRVSVIAMP